MSFLQTKEVLERLSRCSKQLLDGYGELHEESLQRPVSELFQQAMQREQALILGLQAYLRSAPKQILGVWFQSPCLHPLRDAVRVVESAEIHKREDAIHLMYQCESAWASVCKHLSASTLSRDVQELFQHLYEVRTQGSRDMMWQSIREGSSRPA